MAVPFHCDANSWSGHYLLTGSLILLLALGLVAIHRQNWRILVPIAGLPAAGLLLGVAADRLDIPVLGHLAQSSNVYRLGATVVPFAALGLLSLVAPATGQRVSRFRLSCFLVLLGVWMTAPDASLPLRNELLPGLVTAILVAGVALAVFRAADARGEALATARTGPAPVLSAALAVFSVILIGHGGLPSVSLSYDRSDPVVAAALHLREVLPAGAVVAAAPRISQLAPLSGRAVVADCKRLPYGGQHWEEFKERVAALGGAQCSSLASGFAGLDPADVLALQRQYGATHVLLLGGDPKVAYARNHWDLVDQVKPAASPLISGGWWVFALPRE
ncbi:MAG: hypothetical protein ACRDZ3_09560 [Acidimicrobiia bacterium]